MADTSRTHALRDSVLRKLRRGSKDDSASSPLETTATRHASINSIQPVQPQYANRLTFFDLPPELRNTIYDLVVSNTSLTLANPPANSSKSSTPPSPPPPPLLLTTKATRHEFLPYLLSSAPITAHVRDFDFRALARSTRSLYATELKALRHNPRLRIALHTRNCSRADLARLRRWLDLRAQCLDRLPWRYHVDVGVMPALPVGRERLLHELGYYRRVLGVFGQGLGEESASRGELEAVLRAFGETEDEVRSGLDDDVVARRMSGIRLIRGLSGGGLR